MDATSDSPPGPPPLPPPPFHLKDFYWKPTSDPHSTAKVSVQGVNYVSRSNASAKVQIRAAWLSVFTGGGSKILQMGGSLGWQLPSMEGKLFVARHAVVSIWVLTGGPMRTRHSIGARIPLVEPPLVFAEQKIMWGKFCDQIGEYFNLCSFDQIFFSYCATAELCKFLKSWDDYDICSWLWIRPNMDEYRTLHYYYYY